MSVTLCSLLSSITRPRGPSNFLAEPLLSSPTAGEALPKAPPSIEAEESGGAKRREIDSAGTSGGGAAAERRRSGVNTAQYRRRRRRRARREENKQGSACGEMDEGCGEMRGEPPEEPQAGGRSHRGYSCTCSARWGASLMHCVHVTRSGGREPKQCGWLCFCFQILPGFSSCQ